MKLGFGTLYGFTQGRGNIAFNITKTCRCSMTHSVFSVRIMCLRSQCQLCCAHPPRRSAARTQKRQPRSGALPHRMTMVIRGISDQLTHFFVRRLPNASCATGSLCPILRWQALDSFCSERSAGCLPNTFGRAPTDRASCFQVMSRLTLVKIKIPIRFTVHARLVTCIFDRADARTETADALLCITGPEAAIQSLRTWLSLP